jgi:hypothetical protein
MSVKLSDDMPSVWFPKANRARVDELIEAAPAVGDLSAKHRPASDSEAQQFTAFLLDAGSPGSAEELLHLTQGTPGLTHAQVALANGPLFVLVIARSWMQGVNAIETTESLARFRRPLLEALEG